MITSGQTTEIREYLTSERLTDTALIDDLVDHISCEIEISLENRVLTFQEAFEQAKRKILPNDPFQVEQDLKILTTKNSNIMIKKTAYIGGYISALLFSLAILFTVISFQNESLVDSRRESMSEQYFATNLGKDLSKEETSGFYQDYYNETSQLKLKAISQSSISQILLIISILLFGITYLPYQFYSRYQRSNHEIQYS